MRPKLRWEGEAEEAEAAVRAADELRELKSRRTGDPIVIGNEFSEIRVCRVETRNGSRLLIESPKSGQWVTLCPLEMESLTWQNADTFAAMIGHPFRPLFEGEGERP